MPTLLGSLPFPSPRRTAREPSTRMMRAAATKETVTRPNIGKIVMFLLSCFLVCMFPAALRSPSPCAATPWCQATSAPTAASTWSPLKTQTIKVRCLDSKICTYTSISRFFSCPGANLCAEAHLFLHQHDFGTLFLSPGLGARG